MKMLCAPVTVNIKVRKLIKTFTGSMESALLYKYQHRLYYFIQPDTRKEKLPSINYNFLDEPYKYKNITVLVL